MTQQALFALPGKIRYQIWACQDEAGGVVRCSPVDADFFGLYEIEPDGCSRWISDHTTAAEAVAAWRKLR